jgi:hypothetical protein
VFLEKFWRFLPKNRGSGRSRRNTSGKVYALTYIRKFSERLESRIDQVKINSEALDDHVLGYMCLSSSSSYLQIMQMEKEKQDKHVNACSSCDQSIIQSEDRAGQHFMKLQHNPH